MHNYKVTHYLLDKTGRNSHLTFVQQEHRYVQLTATTFIWQTYGEET